MSGVIDNPIEANGRYDDGYVSGTMEHDPEISVTHDRNLRT